MAFVYWIHLPEHKDIKTEGYVGFTSMTIKKRMNLHKSQAKNNPHRQIITRAINKYGDRLLHKVLAEGSKEYCLELERKLRPTPNIGWNIGIGGGQTRLGQHNSKEHIAKFIKARKGIPRTPECIEAMSRGAKAYFAGKEIWELPVTNKTAWEQAEYVYKLVIEQKLGSRMVAKALGIKRDSAVYIVRRIKAGWNPSEDAAWIKHFKEGADEKTE